MRSVGKAEPGLYRRQVLQSLSALEFKQRGRGHNGIRQVALGTLIDVANREV